MFRLLIILNCSQTSFTLNYKTWKDAQAAEKIINAQMGQKQNSVVSVDDDYGHRATIDTFMLAACMVVDLELAFEVEAQVSFIKARAQKKLENLVRNDPGMRLVAGVQ